VRLARATPVPARGPIPMELDLSTPGAVTLTAGAVSTHRPSARAQVTPSGVDRSPVRPYLPGAGGSRQGRRDSVQASSRPAHDHRPRRRRWPIWPCPTVTAGSHGPRGSRPRHRSYTWPQRGDRGAPLQKPVGPDRARGRRGFRSTAGLLSRCRQAGGRRHAVRPGCPKVPPEVDVRVRRVAVEMSDRDRGWSGSRPGASSSRASLQSRHRLPAREASR